MFSYLAHRAAVGESRFGESGDFARRIVAHHVKMMLQRRVFGSLEINQLRRLVHPNLRTGGTLRSQNTTEQEKLLESFINTKEKKLNQPHARTYLDSFP